MFGDFMNYFMGIDNGGTATKAAIYDSGGRELAVAVRETDRCPGPIGYAERDMENMWRTNCQVIWEALERSSLSPAQICGIACCGHGKGLYLWGKDGRPARRGILSADTRAAGYVKRWQQDGTEDRAYRRSLQMVMPCQPAALLAWLRDHEPQTIAQIQWVFSCKDYIRFRLTGRANGELSDMSGTNLVNLTTKAYDRQLLEIFGIDFAWDMPPPLCTSTQLCGRVTAQAARECGLAEGTPVYGGMFDIDACALATGAVDSRKVCMIAGTWSINEYVSDQPVTDGSVAMNSLFCLNEQYLIEESSPTSAGNLEWILRRILCCGKEPDGESVYAKADKLVESAGVQGFGPIFLPFVLASNINPAGMGAFVGLAEQQDQRVLLRSVYEGIVFAHRWHLERLLRSKREPVDVIRLAGGPFRRLGTDVCRHPAPSHRGS